LFELGGAGTNYVDDTWDFSKQYEGLLTVSRAGTYAGIKTKANTYREVSVTVSDLAPSFNADTGKGNFKMQIYFTFANGKQFQIRLHNENTGGAYTVQNMAKDIITSWTKVTTLDAKQVTKLQSEAGIAFHIKLEGTNAIIYLDDVQVGTLDLSAGITAEDTASITMIMYGNNGQTNVEIPFTLG
jgi:hypothetical protein